MRVVVTVDPANPGQIDRVAAGLVEAGMAVEQILSTTGIVVGSIDADSLPAISRLAGVAAVEQDRDFRIPLDGQPPD